MVANNPISVADVKRVLRRWWWILPITTIFFGAAGVLASMVLPKKYMSRTLVLVESPAVSSKLVEPVITEDLNTRLSSMKEQILSRNRLQPIIEKLGLYPEQRAANAHIEDLVDRLRSSVNVTPVEPMAGTQNRQLPGFYINVTFNNGQLAQQVCAEITSMFLEQNARERQTQSNGTIEFFQDRLNEAKKKLDDEDAKLAEFKSRHPGEMPDQAQTNLSLLSGMNTQLESNTQSLSRAQQEKTFNESLLAQQLATLHQVTADGGGPTPDTLDQQLSALQEKLVSQQALYTPEHPDVLKTQRAIEDLKRRIASQQNAPAPTKTTAKPSGIEPPQIQQLRAKLRLDDQNIADLTKAQAKIQNDVRIVQGRIEATPLVEQQFKDMTRDYQTASDNFNDLLKKRTQSEVAGHLENQQMSEQFRVFEAANLPSQPSFPNRLIFAGGGFGGGLALGLALLYLFAVMDKSLHTERDVELGLKLPLLVSIPALDVVAGQAKRVAEKVKRDLQAEPSISA